MWFSTCLILPLLSAVLVVAQGNTTTTTTTPPATTPTPAPTPTPAAPGLTFLYSCNVSVGLPVTVGSIPEGNRSVVPIIGGQAIGPKIIG
jgi:hypothetical protein